VNSSLVVTNSHILCAYPIEIIGSVDCNLNGVVVPKDVFNRLKWMGDVPVKKNRLVEPELICKDEYIEVYFLNELVYRARYIDSVFPKWDSVMPKDCGSVTESIFDIKRLNKLSQCFPTEASEFKVTYHDGGKKIKLTSHQDLYQKPIEALFMASI